MNAPDFPPRRLLRLSIWLSAPVLALAMLGPAGAAPQPPASSANITYVAMPAGTRGKPDLYLLDPASGTSVKLTGGEDFHLGPAPSPDGRHIAFTNGRALWLLDSVSGERTELVEGATSPSWSRDGRRLAWVKRGEGLFVGQADGTEARRLTGDLGKVRPERNAAFSPDGARIAYYDNASPPARIWLMDADGGNKRPLTEPTTHNFAPAWSPDGRRIAFVSKRDGDDEIYIIGVDGSGESRLTRNPDYDTLPTWSPDGSRIAFESGRDEAYGIYLMRTDGSEITLLTNPELKAGNPYWTFR